MCSDDIELLGIDILLPKTKPILVVNCYRPPTCNDFFEKLETCITSSPQYYQQETYLLGDFNTDVSCSSPSFLTKRYANFTRLLNLKQLIKDPTRISESKISIIDLILVSDNDKVS